MRFIHHWLGDFLRLALALACALLTMQIPAVTHEVLAGLQQVAIASRRDIDQREDAVRDRYQITATNDADLIATLQSKEPANADGLRASVANSQAAQTDATTIAASPPLLQPIIATRLWLTDRTGAVQPVVSAALDSFVPEVILSTASATYALAGLLLGSLLAHLILAPFARAQLQPADTR